MLHIKRGELASQLTTQKKIFGHLLLIFAVWARSCFGLLGKVGFLFWD